MTKAICILMTYESDRKPSNYDNQSIKSFSEKKAKHWLQLHNISGFLAVSFEKKKKQLQSHHGLCEIKLGIVQCFLRFNRLKD